MVLLDSFHVQRPVSFLALLADTFRVQRPVSFQALLCHMPVPILKHRIEFGARRFALFFLWREGISSKTNFTNKRFHTKRRPKISNYMSYTDRIVDKSFATAPVVFLFGIDNSKLIKILPL